MMEVPVSRIQDVEISVGIDETHPSKPIVATVEHNNHFAVKLLLEPGFREEVINAIKERASKYGDVIDITLAYAPKPHLCEFTISVS